MKYSKIIFEDHFDAKKLNQKIWNYEIGFIRNHEPQYYTDRTDNCYLQNSILKIITKKEKYYNAQYTSASINTMGKVSFLYGRFEIRAKLPFSKGLWPAFWMMGDDFPVIGWPKCGEIDIMEMIANTTEISNRKMTMSLHWYSNEINSLKSSIESFVDNNGKFADDFHIYAIEWEEKELRWYYDDRIIRKTPINDDMLSCFNKPMFILLNTALSDWNDNERPDNINTVFPQEYCIDYVRVYK